jgi:hypothetical protein
MATLIDTITQQLDPGTIQQISQQLGTDERTTSHAVEMALPLLVGGLARNAQQPQGAQALHGALLKDHDGSLLDNLGGLLGGRGAGGMGGGGAMGGMGGLGGVGGAILGHVLGGKRAPVEAGIGRATGMNGSQVSQLLVLLAPVVMAALGRMARQRNADPGALGGMLQEEQQEVARRAPGAGGLGGLLDSDNDGQIMDDLARMAPGMLGGLFGGRR